MQFHRMKDYISLIGNNKSNKDYEQLIGSLFMVKRNWTHSFILNEYGCKINIYSGF